MRTRLSRKLSLMSCKGGSSTEADKLTLLLTTLSAKLEAIVMAVKDD